jgi:hypothetical protein
MTAAMSAYPDKTSTFTFDVRVIDATTAAPAAVAFPPFLETDVSESIKLEPGASWSLTL